MNILFIGDIVGRAGRRAIREFLPEFKSEDNIDIVIANGENSAGGFGITAAVAEELFGYGIDCITMGNHTWNNKDIFSFIDDEPRLIRPLNYLPGVPGKGWTIIKNGDTRIGVINLVGQVYLEGNNSPLMIFNEYISRIEGVTDAIVVDFHAEATGEKLAFANCVDGRVAAVVGTHTHVQTSDAMILESGTAYITDLGLTGAIDSILGMDKEDVMNKYKTNLPGRYSVATGDCKLEGALISVDKDEGLSCNIKTIRRTNKF